MPKKESKSTPSPRKGTKAKPNYVNLDSDFDDNSEDDFKPDNEEDEEDEEEIALNILTILIR